MDAQAHVLHFLDHVSLADLRDYGQSRADSRVSELLGISRAHAVLLRIVNDGQDGAPTSVIRNPEQVLGDQAQAVLAFWRHLDRMTPNDWAAAMAAGGAAARAAGGAAARDAARSDAWAAAWAAAWDAAWDTAWAAVWDDAGAAARTAAGATNEIQGADVMGTNSQPFLFLPFFGFANPEAVMAADKAATDTPTDIAKSLANSLDSSTPSLNEEIPNKMGLTRLSEAAQ